VTFVSIPLAVLAAVIVVDAVGWTINTMTLGGLAVALGVVVDDAIIGVENIVRRLRGTHAHGLEAREVIHNATVEVRAPVVYATFVVVLVLAPMLLLAGLEGSFFAPVAAAALPLFGSELMPPFREGHFVVQAYATPGTSLTAMRALGARVARDLLAIPGIVTVEQTMGRAESGEDTWEPNRSEFHVELG